MKSGDILNAIWISDIHLGHPRVSTLSILQGLYKVFRPSPEMEKVDLITIAGDLFDGLLSLPDEEVDMIQMFFRDLLQMCGELNIRLRVLEGTPSHDRAQSRHLVTVNNTLPKAMQADLLYVDTVKVVREEGWDLDFLYVPDEWHHDPDVVWEDVRQALKDFGVDAVDYSVMHGMFEQQLPPHVKIPTHNSKNYLSITRKLIDIGHDHHPKRLGKILINGSFDRISHNEEHAKGYWHTLTHRDTDVNDKITFVTNPDATPHVTVNILDDDLETALDKLTRKARELKRGGIRPHMRPSASFTGMVNDLAKTFTHLRWTTKLETEATKQLAKTTKEKVVVKNMVEPAALKANLLAEVKLNSNGDSAVLNNAAKILEGIMNG